MSVQIPVSSFNNNHIIRINKDLLVKPIQKDKKSFFGNITPSSKPIECFDIFSQSGKDFASIPLSYYFHHLSNINSISFDYSSCENLNFEGSLLDRQKKVREEILEILNRTKSVVLSLHTGFGKTVMALYLTCKIKLKTIILCHRKIIIDQWVSSIKKYIPDANFAILGEPPKKKDKKDSPNFVSQNENWDILIANVINVPKQDKSFYSDVGLVIVDEIHTICTNSFSKSLLHLFPRYLIGLSATPFRTDGMDKILELFCGPEVVYRKLYKPFNVYKLQTNFKPESRLNISGGLDWNSILEGQASDDDRNNLIIDLCRYFVKRNILVLVKRKEHALLLQEKLNKFGEIVDIFMDTKRTFNYDCRILIATYSKGGVGFDHPKLDMLIGGADVEEGFMQYIGRIFRRDDVCPMYIDLVDNMSTIKKHATTRLKICKEIGAEVKDFHKCFKDFGKLINLLN
jgi:superfamily II DNA or RNA helicase